MKYVSTTSLYPSGYCTTQTFLQVSVKLHHIQIQGCIFKIQNWTHSSKPLECDY